MVHKVKKGKMNKKKRALYIVTLLLVLSVATVIYAKYIMEYKNIVAPIPDSVADYYMDVIWDGNDSDNGKKLSQKLKLDEINPGETKVISFMVRNGDGTNFSDVNFDFTIDLIHTENLPLTYDLYQYIGATENADPIYKLLSNYSVTDTNDYENSKNTGLIRKYSESYNAATKFTLLGNSMDVDGNRVIDGRKFRLVITWDDRSIDSIDNKYTREVDDVYLVVNVSQKE